MENLYIILVLVALGYVAFYISGRKYLERFENPKTTKTTTMSGPIMQPGNYTDEYNQDAYEISQVYQNQGKEASKKQISDAMTRYPLDWSVQGPGSQMFQENQARYEKTKKNVIAPEPYQNVPTDMMLPDGALLEDEERKLLQMYKPETSKGLLHYSMHDVNDLLKKLYGKKGLIPVVKKSKQGNNVWEIVEVKEKNPTIVWEDSPVDSTRNTMTLRGEEVIEVPYAVGDVTASLDPFMRARERVRTGGTAITENSELGRMFQPTYPIPNWN
jgi:hypothetical protein